MGRTRPSLQRLKEYVYSQLDALIEPGTAVSLVDFPTHTNVGDFVIWLGELEYLRDRGCRLAYVSTLGEYDPARLKRLAPEGPILLHGGGNVGDIWPAHQKLRERILANFPDRPVVQLPQSVYFASKRVRERSLATMAVHPGFTLLARDRQSHALCAPYLGDRVQLCPDMAFALGSLKRPSCPSADVVCLLRTDHEADQDRVGKADGCLQLDWVHRRTRTHEVKRRAALSLAARTRRHAIAAPALSRLSATGFAALAREELRMGVSILGAARAVVTDRLHGHILCELLGTPHVLLDNSYGKLSSFHTTWTAGSELCSEAPTIDAALAKAHGRSAT